MGYKKINSLFIYYLFPSMSLHTVVTLYYNIYCDKLWSRCFLRLHFKYSIPDKHLSSPLTREKWTDPFRDLCLFIITPVEFPSKGPREDSPVLCSPLPFQIPRKSSSSLFFGSEVAETCKESVLRILTCSTPGLTSDLMALFHESSHVSLAMPAD